MDYQYSRFEQSPIGFNSRGRPLYRKLPLTPFEKVLNVASIALIIATWVYVWVALKDLPDRIPVHFDITGQPDRFGSKYELLIMPGIGTFIAIVLQLVTLCPQSYNLPKIQITADNGARIYTYARILMRVMSVLISGFFVFVLVTWINAVKKEKSLDMGIVLGCSAVFIFLIGTSICVFTKKCKN